MKKITQFLLSAVLLCSLFLNLGCKKDDGSCPTCPTNIEPGRRDYTWFIDTIYAGGNIIRGIDGVSPNDVWVISTPGDLSKTFYHFDGTRWSTDGVNRSIAPAAIRAFASNNVWSVGLGSEIWHYDGNAWNSQTKLTADSSSYYSLEDIDGISSTNMYAVGYDITTGTGVLLFFDGNIWNKLYERNYTTPIEPYGGTSAVWGYDTSHIYISTGYGSYLGNRFAWQQINIPAPVWTESIRGESYKNIFFIGDFGLVVHWNGKSWYRYDQFFIYAQGNGDNLYGVWAKNKTVFVVSRSQTAQGIVYRGTQ